MSEATRYEYPGLDPFLPEGTDYVLGREAISNKRVMDGHWAAAQLGSLSAAGHDDAAKGLIPTIERHVAVLELGAAILKGVLAHVHAYFAAKEPPAPAEPEKAPEPKPERKAAK